MSGSQKGINRKNEVGEGEEHWPFKFPGSHLAGREAWLQQ